VTAAASFEARDRPSVLVVGENASTRAGVRLALEPTTDCFEARTSAEAARIAAEAFPSVCLVAPGPGGEMLLVSEVSAAVPYAHIIVLTSQVHEEQLLAAVRAGAVGYLSVDVDPARLPFVVRGVMRGEAAIPRVLVGRLVSELRERGKRRLLLLESRHAVDLTSREWEVLELLGRRSTTKQMAASLSISEVTVRRHVGTLLKKLGVGDRITPRCLRQLPAVRQPRNLVDIRTQETATTPRSRKPGRTVCAFIPGEAAGSSAFGTSRRLAVPPKRRPPG
jgi:two-component system nitrate/nitrite response regulator NarL